MEMAPIEVTIGASKKRKERSSEGVSLGMGAHGQGTEQFCPFPAGSRRAAGGRRQDRAQDVLLEPGDEVLVYLDGVEGVTRGLEQLADSQDVAGHCFGEAEEAGRMLRACVSRGHGRYRHLGIVKGDTPL
jgi:hypothetical protein